MSEPAGFPLPPRISVEEVRRELERTRAGVVLATRSTSRLARELFGDFVAVGADVPIADASLVVAVGGGALIDRAKWSRRQHAGPIRLVAVPTIWGSGSEASRIVVLNEPGRKRILVGDEWLPDAICWSPEFLSTVPADLATWACGDAWSHAIEGFLSPVASDAVRAGLAEVMRDMLSLPLRSDVRWYEVSARACAGQSRSSVGLVHGIAHVLEPHLGVLSIGRTWGHARLCSAFLGPVLRFNLGRSDKAAGLLASYGIDSEALLSVASAVGEPVGSLVGLLEDLWTDVLRDPCTRTNVALVRPGSFEELRRELQSP